MKKDCLPIKIFKFILSPNSFDISFDLNFFLQSVQAPTLYSEMSIGPGTSGTLWKNCPLKKRNIFMAK